MLAQGDASPKHFLKIETDAKTPGDGNNPLIFFLKAAIQRAVNGVFLLILRCCLRLRSLPKGVP
jgi:hypothetical protein